MASPRLPSAYADVVDLDRYPIHRLDGDRCRVRVLPSAPGTLAFFRGEHALHRVESSRPRINSVPTYGVRPDMRLNDLTSQLFYGRTSSRSADLS